MRVTVIYFKDLQTTEPAFPEEGGEVRDYCYTVKRHGQLSHQHHHPLFSYSAAAFFTRFKAGRMDDYIGICILRNGIKGWRTNTGVPVLMADDRRQRRSCRGTHKLFRNKAEN